MLSSLPLLLFRRMKPGIWHISSNVLHLACAAFVLYMLMVLNYLFTTPATEPIPWWVGIWVSLP